jgi:aminoglycoside phosphotransferase (APT) family kinase protein
LDRLADLEAGWPAATGGRTLLHADLRADNLLLTPTRVVAVDWPYACVGAAWVDLLLLLPSVTMQGGPDPEPTFAAHPVAAGADPPAVTTALAAWAGFLIGGSRLPPPPGLPNLRTFQLGQGMVALDWLRHRTGWP